MESTLEEYIAELDYLLMKCDIAEPNQQTIACNLGGLKMEIENIIQLQSYWTYSNIVKLALKVGK